MNVHAIVAEADLQLALLLGHSLIKLCTGNVAGGGCQCNILGSRELLV